ncbi:DUF2065 domain-containing protein [Legionella nagasakiensis]|uniref:DUF2065 domain-containing protein n=1 Tax=Legionella nagasakiensis TaxID=535290 RepID=UPI001056016B|nr:DUF2065 domain-containing protein [Legionella nagasakiensis]
MGSVLINFLSALALVFVFEGLMPFAFPERWKKLLSRITEQDEKVIRISGFLSMMVGVILLTIIHQFVK